MIQSTTPGPTKPPSSAQRAVYRLFDEAGELLYVGSSNNPERRWKQHASDKPWWPEVARKEAIWHPWRESWDKETEAIRKERPKHNTMSTPEYGAQVSRRQRANVETQRVKCRVAYRANQLRFKVAAELMASGVGEDEATAEGMIAERAYKEASGAFPNGVDYPPLDYITKRRAAAAAAAQ